MGSAKQITVRTAGEHPCGRRRPGSCGVSTTARTLRPCASRTLLWLLSAAVALTPTATQCDFDGDIDPDKQMMGLVQDYNAYSLDVCKENCCTDTSCTAYQFQQGFHGQMSCMRGCDFKGYFRSLLGLFRL